MKVGVIGLGYWGPNLVRNLVQLERQVYVFDRLEERVRAAHERFPECIPVAAAADVIENPEIEAVVIAVQLQEHARLVLEPWMPASTSLWRSRCAPQWPKPTGSRRASTARF